MMRGIPQKPKNTSRLFKSLSAYVINREKVLEETPVSSKEKNAKNANEGSAPNPEEHKPVQHKQLDVQVLITEVEDLLKTMDQADARVQRILSKLHELKTAILLMAEKG